MLVIYNSWKCNLVNRYQKNYHAKLLTGNFINFSVAMTQQETKNIYSLKPPINDVPLMIKLSALRYCTAHKHIRMSQFHVEVSCVGWQQISKVNLTISISGARNDLV